MVRVPAETAASSISGSGIAASPAKWLSGSQKDWYPHCSAKAA
jgi:hypothetical protein